MSGLRHEVLVAVIAGNNITILSTIARISGGTYEPLLEQSEKWRKGTFNWREQQEFLDQYLSSMLLCGKPQSVDKRRWLLKCLSNDQTAFTGATSLVDVVEDDRLGYEGRIRFLPKASFAEPFALECLTVDDQKKLSSLNEKIRSLDSTKIDDINVLLRQAEALAPVNGKRDRGKAPIFFYSVTDKPFQLPATVYQRMEKAAKLVSEGISEVAARFNGSLEKALWGSSDKTKRQFYTGSIDFMMVNNRIYIIDIGAPAVGCIADIVFAAEALGRVPEIGLDYLAAAAGRKAALYSGKSDLGFFAFETAALREALLSRGVDLDIVEGKENEICLGNENFPSASFDYLSRNQPLRNRILAAMAPSLCELGVSVPQGIVTIPEQGELQRFYDETRKGSDYGLLVKKKVLFREYSIGSGYFKPLVVPLWDTEFKSDVRTSTLVEEFIPSLIDCDVAGGLQGERCFEIRMYFCQGEQ